MCKTLKEIDLLYIEDNDIMSDLMVKYLNRCECTRFNIIVKNTLKKGMEYLDNAYLRLDIILLDLVLPNSEGVNTFKSINEAYGDFLPIIIISGHEDMACQCVRLGAQDYLLKTSITSGLLTRSIKYAIERKKIKDKLKTERDKSIQNEKKFRDLVEITKASIYEIDFINNKFVYVNDFLCKQIGYTREELMKMTPYDILTKKSVDIWINRMNLLTEGKHISSSAEYEVVKKDGSLAWILITAKFIEDNNNITGANVVAIDITDRKLMEESLKKKEEDVYATLENKIRDWREEIVIRNIKRDTQLEKINDKIQSMTNTEIPNEQ